MIVVGSFLIQSSDKLDGYMLSEISNPNERSDQTDDGLIRRLSNMNELTHVERLSRKARLTKRTISQREREKTKPSIVNPTAHEFVFPPGG